MQDTLLKRRHHSHFHWTNFDIFPMKSGSLRENHHQRRCISLWLVALVAPFHPAPLLFDLLHCKDTLGSCVLRRNEIRKKEKNSSRKSVQSTLLVLALFQSTFSSPSYLPHPVVACPGRAQHRMAESYSSFGKSRRSNEVHPNAEPTEKAFIQSSRNTPQEALSTMGVFQRHNHEPDMCCHCYKVHDMSSFSDLRERELLAYGRSFADCCCRTFLAAICAGLSFEPTCLELTDNERVFRSPPPLWLLVYEKLIPFLDR